MGAYTAFLDLALGVANPALGLVVSGAGLRSVFLVSALVVMSAATIAVRAAEGASCHRMTLCVKGACTMEARIAHQEPMTDERTQGGNEPFRRGQSTPCSRLCFLWSQWTDHLPSLQRTIFYHPARCM
jgi:hypothetical protein